MKKNLILAVVLAVLSLLNLILTSMLLKTKTL